MKTILRELKRWAKQWRLRCQSHAIILMYHRVAELETDPQLLAVSPQHFAEHLHILRQKYHPISLTELVCASSNHQIPSRSVVVTFDDGYADNLYNAKALLEHDDVPATVFVTAGMIGQSQELWWDELERLLLQPGTLPKELAFMFSGKRYQWQLAPFQEYTQAEYAQHRRWNVQMVGEPTVRHAMYRELYALLRPLTPDLRQIALHEIALQIGQEQHGRDNYRVMTSTEIRQLSEGGLITVGAHGIAHPMLSILAPLEQRRDIQDGKSQLETILGKPVQHYAYPYGGREDYTPTTRKIVRQIGFDSACSTLQGVVWPYADRFQLPRVIVRDWTGDEFARQLAEWFS